MIQRFVKEIIKVGNSAAVMLPASFVKEGNLKIGDEVIVETMARYQAAMIKPKKIKRLSIFLRSFFIG
jgi:antitoxin component of MazEF toxin-antitoxin module